MTSTQHKAASHLLSMGCLKENLQYLYHITPVLFLVLEIKDNEDAFSCTLTHFSYLKDFKIPSYNISVDGTLYNYIKSLVLFPNNPLIRALPTYVTQSLQDWCTVYPKYSYNGFKAAITRDMEMSYIVVIEEDKNPLENIVCLLHTYKKEVNKEIEIMFINMTESKGYKASRPVLFESDTIVDILKDITFTGVQAYCRKAIIDNFLETT